MFWGDIVYRHPETYARLPKETICLNWGYLPNQREDEIRTLAEMGATQYACPGVCTWNRWLPLMENSYKNIRVMCRHGKNTMAIACSIPIGATMGISATPWLSVPGTCTARPFRGTHRKSPLMKSPRAISFLEYGDRSEAWVSALAQLTDHEVWDWFHAVRWIEEGDAAKQAENPGGCARGARSHRKRRHRRRAGAAGRGGRRSCGPISGNCCRLCIRRPTGRTY